jgi:putative DNA primase/helicase
MYQETRVRDKDVAISLYATCLWYIHQYINPPEIQYTELDERENLRLLYDVIIDHLIKKYMIISANDCIYIYIDSMYYEDRGRIEKDINKILKQGGYSRTRKITEIVREIMKRIKAETMKFKEFPFNKKARYMVPVRNGVVVRKQLNMLMPKSPVWGFTYSLQVDYNPDAPTEPIDKFLHDIVSEEDAGILVQAVAQALLQNENYQLSYLLTGQGANGKSTYISLVTTLLGMENITAISIQDLIEDKFKAAELQGKLMNLYADLPKTSLKTTGQFKILTGGDTMVVEKKFHQPFKMINKAVFVFSANELPEVNDATFAFWRRWAVIDFPHKFKNDPTFKDRLITDENISGFLNMVIAKMDEIEERGIHRSDKVEEIMQAWQKRSNSAFAFISETIVRDVGGFIPKEVLWSEYQMYCKANDFTPVSKVAFKSEIERNGGIEEQRQVNKVRVRGFTGIRRVTDPPSESEIALRKKQDTTKATMLIFDEEDEQDK